MLDSILFPGVEDNARKEDVRAAGVHEQRFGFGDDGASPSRSR
jgi:hypothetical protein